MRFYPGGDRNVVRVTLSRRNLRALLRKLDEDDSARTIYTDYDTPTGWQLQVVAEADAEHYDDRAAPGPMHPDTEAALAREDATVAMDPSGPPVTEGPFG